MRRREAPIGPLAKNLSELEIRPAQAGDWEAIRRICCETGASGEPVARERWPFFAEHWIGPYQALLPEWTWVAADAKGGIVGYLTGCPETSKFEARRRVRHTSRLFVKSCLGFYGFGADVTRFVRRLLHVERSPNRSFARSTERLIAREFPAHLHVNLDRQCRGGGVGRRLIEAFRDRLRKSGAPGLHVFCGEGPLEFYARVGFHVIESVSFQPRGARDAVRVHCLGLKTGLS